MIMQNKMYTGSPEELLEYRKLEITFWEGNKSLYRTSFSKEEMVNWSNYICKFVRLSPVKIVVDNEPHLADILNIKDYPNQRVAAYWLNGCIHIPEGSSSRIFCHELSHHLQICGGFGNGHGPGFIEAESLLFEVILENKEYLTHLLR